MKTVLVRAQIIMTAKKINTKGHEPIAFRILSADLSPRERSSPERTPGCLCQWLFQAVSCIIEFSHGATAPKRTNNVVNALATKGDFLNFAFENRGFSLSGTPKLRVAPSKQGCNTGGEMVQWS